MRLCTAYEVDNIESGVWDDEEVFIYKTLKHIKFCLANGEAGIVRTLDVPVFLIRVLGSKIYCLNEDAEVSALAFGTTEYLFKSSFLKNECDKVFGMVKSPELSEEAILSYLMQKDRKEYMIRLQTLSAKATAGLVMKKHGTEKVFRFPPADEEKYEDYDEECRYVNSSAYDPSIRRPSNYEIFKNLL